ncbi:MAG TPA: hypothetical protein VHA12_00420 [Candidatus Nanoarchaeia archaeon]|nr:hypothetical protein [Candidatus Nanoarchaeia archaeon]
MVDWITVIISVLSAIIVTIIGAITTPYFQHRRNLELIRQEAIFKIRLDNYHFISETLDNRINLYNKILRDIWNGSSNIEKENVDYIHNSNKELDEDISKRLSAFSTFSWKEYAALSTKETLLLIMLKSKDKKENVQKELLKLENIIHRIKSKMLKELNINFRK